MNDSNKNPSLIKKIAAFSAAVGAVFVGTVADSPKKDNIPEYNAAPIVRQHKAPRHKFDQARYWCKNVKSGMSDWAEKKQKKADQANKIIHSKAYSPEIKQISQLKSAQPQTAQTNSSTNRGISNFKKNVSGYTKNATKGKSSGLSKSTNRGISNFQKKANGQTGSASKGGSGRASKSSSKSSGKSGGSSRGGSSKGR